MNDLTPFEKEIRQTYRLPNANQTFFNNLEAKLLAHQPHRNAKAKFTFRFSSGWAYAMVTLLFVGVMVLAIGPVKVLAQIQAIFGFVPEVGLVDTSSPFRQLSEPVSDTKDGVTLTVQSAFLSADQTTITYAMSDLPAGVKPNRFGDPECSIPAYLTLPDGSKVGASGSSSSLEPNGLYVHDIHFKDPLPEKFNHATLVFPCLKGAAQGKGPEEWQFVLAFKPASEYVAVYPATLMPPQVEKENLVPAIVVDGDRHKEMVVLSVVEKPETYWVTWAYPNKLDNDIQIDGHLYILPFNPVIYDANGIELPAPDHETQVELWKYEDSLRNKLSGEDQLKYLSSIHTFVVPKSGVAFPVYAKQNVYERSFPEKEAYAEIKFDSARVQTAEGPVQINQEIQLGSIKFKLDAIEMSQYGGYSFIFDGTEGRVVQCLIELVGHPTDMGGGSSFNPGDPFHFNQAILYRQIPTGELTVRVSQPAVLGDLISFIGSWSPEK